MSSQEEFELMEKVVATFVSNYYRTLLTAPLSMQEWYGKDSFFASGVAPIEQSKAHQMAGGELIKEKIEKLAADLNKSKISVMQVDWQPTVARSAMVSVWGAAVTSSEVKHFHHSVVLSPGTSDGAFYIRNDIFQFLPQVVVPVKEEAAPVEEVAEPVQEEAAAEEEVGEEAEPEAEEEAEEEAVEEEADEESAAAAEEEEEETAAAAGEAEEPVEEKPAPVEEKPAAKPATGGKWSNIVSKPATATATAKQPQRVMQNAPRVATPPPQEEAAPAAAAKKKEPRAPKEPAHGIMFVTKHEVTEEEMKVALGDKGKHLINARQVPKKDGSGYMVFAEFRVDVLEDLRTAQPFVGGRNIIPTAQRQR